MSFYLCQSPLSGSIQSFRSLMSYNESERLTAVGANTTLQTTMEQPVERAYLAGPAESVSPPVDLPPSYSRVDLADMTSLAPSDIGSNLFQPLQPLRAAEVDSTDFRGIHGVAQVIDPSDVPLTRSGITTRTSIRGDRSGVQFDRQMRELVSIYTPHSGARPSNSTVNRSEPRGSSFQNRVRASIRGEARSVIDRSTQPIDAVVIDRSSTVIDQQSHEARVAASIAASGRVSVPERRSRYLQAMARLNGTTNPAGRTVPTRPPPVGPPSPVDLVAQALANLPIIPTRRSSSNLLNPAHREISSRQPAQYDSTEIREVIPRTPSFTWSSFRSTPRESQAPTPPPKEPPPVPPRDRTAFHLAGAYPRLTRRVPRPQLSQSARRAHGSTSKTWFSCLADSALPDVYHRHYDPSEHTYRTSESTSPETGSTNPSHSTPGSVQPPPSAPIPLPAPTPAWPGETGTCPPPVSPRSHHHGSDPELSTLLQECRALVTELYRVRKINMDRRRNEQMEGMPPPPLPPRPVRPPEIHVPEEVYTAVRSRRRFALARAASNARLNTFQQTEASSNATLLVEPRSQMNVTGRAVHQQDHAGSHRTRYTVERPLSHAGWSKPQISFGQGVSTISIGQSSSVRPSATCPPMFGDR